MKNLTKQMAAFIIGGASLLLMVAPVKAEADSHIAQLLPEKVFDEMFPNRNYYLKQPAYSAYQNVIVDLNTGLVDYTANTVKGVDYEIATYEGLIEAAKGFPEFCNNGSAEADKRELAAFFGNVSQETAVGWGSFDEDSDRYKYGLGLTIEGGQIILNSHQNSHAVYTPVDGKSYQGRGALQLSYNENYGRFGEYKGDKDKFLNNPDIIGLDPILFWESAIWFWMTREREDTATHWNKPSCHEAINGYEPTTIQREKYGIRPGYGLTVIVINGGVEGRKNLEYIKEEIKKAEATGDNVKLEKWREAKKGLEEKVLSRINFYKRYCKILGVGPGPEDTIDPLKMDPFAQEK